MTLPDGQHRLISDKSTLTVHTFAEGMLSKLAHDLELRASGLSGTATIHEGKVDLELTIDVPSIEVVGAVKAGRVDHGVLSDKDKRDIIKKLRSDVLSSSTVTITSSAVAAAGSLSPTVRIAHGGRSATVSPSATVDVAETGTITAKGSTRVTLSGLGIKPVKGPLGAFRLSDGVTVTFSLCFAS